MIGLKKPIVFLSVDTTFKDSYNYYLEIQFLKCIGGECFMNIKRCLTLVMTLLIVFSLSSCKGTEDTSLTQESTTIINDYVNETVAESVANSDATISDIATEQVTQLTTQSAESTVVSTQTQTTTTETFDDPANWSTKRIVSEYKKAAKKSNSTAKSTQSIAIKDMSVNDGEYENAMSFIKTIISKFLVSNSTEKDGITGGFENLVPEDISSAKAYKSGEDTVVEMTMVEQTSGVNEDANSGSVGHAITTVGDISVVVKDLADRGLPLELSEDETYIYYTNPTVKVTINENGEIISGTWQYTVEISMNNFKAFGHNVEKASIVMGNTITV